MVRKILIITVGEQKEPLYEGIRKCGNISKIFLLASNFTKKYAEEIKENIKKLYSSEIIEIKADNLNDVISKIILIHKNEKNCEFIYNISGGTKVMSLGCHVIASFLGEKLIYILKKEDGSMDALDIPILKYNLNKIACNGDKRYSLLKLLKEKPTTLTELSKKLKLKKPTVSGHIKKLHNLITFMEKNGKNRGICISKTGEIFLNLLEVVE